MWAFIVVLALSASALGQRHKRDLFIDRSVCYGDLGCFKTADFRSFRRPIVLLPDDPVKINTKFFLYTRQNPTADKEQEISYEEPLTIAKSYYNDSIPTKIIVHGFTHDAHQPWVQEMVKQLLIQGDYNVIAVDWRVGAKPLYTQATANTQVVGRQLPKLIKVLLPNPTDSAEDFHIIGHSLGAHIAGYTGDSLYRLGRITALDAASPYFEGTQESMRLDARDAEFVDAIHTDGSGFLSTLGMGFAAPLGDVDFYPNGGSRQPGCDHDNKISNSLTSFFAQGYTGAEAQFACSHTRAITFFTESINSKCTFRSYPCKDNTTFGAGECLKCDSGSTCATMGFYANQSPARGSFYLLTEPSAPYCGNHYMVRVQAGQIEGKVKGTLTVTVNGTKGVLSDLLMFEKEVATPDQVHVKLLHTRQDLGSVSTAVVSYEKTTSFFDSFLYTDFYKLGALDVFMGERQEITVFCGKQIAIDANQFRTFTPSATKTC